MATADREPRNQVLLPVGDELLAVNPPPEPDFEPETEALDSVVEDIQSTYASIVTHLDTCVRGLKELREKALVEAELLDAIERARQEVRFGAALLAELEKLDATGRPKTEASETLSNGHAESLPTGSY